MKSFARMLYPYLIWIAIMILAPMLLIILYAFTKQGNSVLTLQFTLENFARFFSDSIFPNVLWRSLKIALITTVICILLGYPAAYFIAKLEGNRKSIMVLLITLPMWINMLVRTYAWRGILLNFPVSSEFKVFVGMVYNFIPTGFPSSRLQFLHSKALRRRRLRSGRQPDRKLFHFYGRLELWFGDLADYGSDHHDLHVHYQEGRL